MELRIEHLDYIYQPGTPYEKTALKDISLTINSGEFVGMIGHTGSGKSTLVQLLNGLLTPGAGTILADGRDISARDYPIRELRQRVGVVSSREVFQRSVRLLFRMGRASRCFDRRLLWSHRLGDAGGMLQGL